MWWSVATLSVERLLLGIGLMWWRVLWTTDRAVGNASTWENTLSGHIVGGTHAPSIIELLDESDNFARSDSELVRHRRREVKMNTIQWSGGGSGGGSHLTCWGAWPGLLDHTRQWHWNDRVVLNVLRSVLGTSVGSSRVREWALAVRRVLVLATTRCAANGAFDDCTDGRAVLSVLHRRWGSSSSRTGSTGRKNNTSGRNAFHNGWASSINGID